MIILDSNVWIAFLNKNDDQHQRAKNLFKKINKQVIITEYIILEIVTVLNMRASKKIADEFLKLTMDNNDIDIIFSDKELFFKTIDIFLRKKNTKLSFVDNSLVYLSRIYEVKTFDKELAKIVEIGIK